MYHNVIRRFLLNFSFRLKLFIKSKFSIKLNFFIESNNMLNLYQTFEMKNHEFHIFLTKNENILIFVKVKNIKNDLVFLIKQ